MMTAKGFNEIASSVGALHQQMPLGEILKNDGVITEDELRRALQEQRSTRERLGKILIKNNYASQEEILSSLGKQFGMKVISLHGYTLDEDVLDTIAPPFAHLYKVIPLQKKNGVLTVALADPLNVHALDDLRLIIDGQVNPVIAPEDQVMAAIEKYYGVREETVDELIESMSEGKAAVKDIEEAPEEDIADLRRMASEAPIIKLVNLILTQAIKDRASDIHIESFETTLKVRYRVDGVLHEIAPPPRHLQAAIISRLKIMADLNIAERRLPQDGRIKIVMGGKEVDLRISCLPTIFGESVVMRVLDKSAIMMDLEQLGFSAELEEQLRTLIKRPNGIILVTGPTGCGKTTTLYACLARINRPDLKIITLEDPVEYQLHGIIQEPVNAQIGLTFARGLRHILRQDPDVILVGEIRDLETAQLAVQASLTGHLVFSTLHTNDAPGAITRLIDMGVEPFLLTSTLEAVLAQRLVRTICKDCKESYTPDPVDVKDIGISQSSIANTKFHRGRGCAECSHTGYRGRSAIAELLTMNDPLRELILKHSSTSEITDKARETGMKSLFEDGWKMVESGRTSIEELAKTTCAVQDMAPEDDAARDEEESKEATSETIPPAEAK
jgi:type II secretion system protein E